MKNLYQKFLKWFNNNADKVLHFAVASVIFMLLSVFFPMYVSIIIVFILAILKEALDEFFTLTPIDYKFRSGAFWDIIASILGAGFTYLMFWLIQIAPKIE